MIDELKHATMESRWITVGGLPIHTRAATDLAPHGALLLMLIHGFVVSSRYIVPTAARLALHAPVYAPDLPGFGKSGDPPKTLNIPEMADALASWMRAASLDRAALLGNSIGCQVIVDLAMRYPELVERAVLVGPTVDPAARSLRHQIWRMLLDVVYERPSLIPLHLRDWPAAGLRRSLATIRYVLADRVEHKLPLVQAPTLVVRGTRRRGVAALGRAGGAFAAPRATSSVAGRATRGQLQQPRCIGTGSAAVP